MSNSELVNFTKISPNSNNPRNQPIRKITIHHMAGNLTVEACGNVFAPSSRQASSNYGVGTDGRVGLYVEERNRAWTSSSPANDHQAVTIEVANGSGAPDWHVSDKALAKLIDLCADICRRNGIAALHYTGDANGNLTRHNMFAETGCPGPYLQSKFPYISAEVNKRLTGQSAPNAPAPATSGLYRVRKTWADANSQKGAFSALANAKACADQNPGYSVFDEKGAAVCGGGAPAAPAYEVYTVVSGDSLWKIAAKLLGNGARYPEVKAFNGLTSDTLRAGQKLKIPKK